ncbi:unannotated protein [freshwater metagenome]|uniref:Unannotated protein n=1 Tax=freshwater metagenome TaxID=449393 RepID=A0A6J7GRU3_9ZZZZ
MPFTDALPQRFAVTLQRSAQIAELRGDGGPIRFRLCWHQVVDVTQSLRGRGDVVEIAQMPPRSACLYSEAKFCGEICLGDAVDIVYCRCRVQGRQSSCGCGLPGGVTLGRKIAITGDVAVTAQPHAVIGVEVAESVNPLLGNAVQFGRLPLVGHEESLTTRSLPWQSGVIRRQALPI